MENVGSEKMRALAAMIKKEIPGLGFALMTFPFGKKGLTNYTSNANRKDMIMLFEEALTALKENSDIETPREN